MVGEESAVPPDGVAWQRMIKRALDGDVACLTEILDGIPGAWERAQVSIEQARRCETVPLSEL